MAPQNPKYSHLIIKEGDIQTVKYDPRGRTKSVARNFGEHGQLLLDGMENIITRHSSTISSLGTNKIAFEIKLHESQKFQDKTRREFLENNKIRINAIKNQTQAIASAAVADFNKFENKVKEYKNTSKNKSEFQFIDSIAPIEIEEKQISKIKEVAKNSALKDEKFDIQAVFLPELTDDEYQTTISNFKQNIKNIGGKLIREPYQLTNGMVIARFEVSGKDIDTVSADEAIYRIEETASYTFEPSESKLTGNLEYSVDENIEPETLPCVVVIDGGIDFSASPQIEPFVLEHLAYKHNEYNNFQHGTAVASRVIFGENIDVQLKTGILVPKARVIDACIFDTKDLTEDNLIEKIKYIVEQYHEKAKIFNMSVNNRKAIDQNTMSLLGYEIDALINKYKIIFTISAGNHNLWKHTDNYDDVLDDDDAIIASPAESTLALTIGAINNEGDPDSLTGKDEISPYSRIGHGFAQNEKPDMVAYGGNISIANNANFGITAISNNGQFVTTSGTSFAAPVIASNAAQIIRYLNNDNNALLTKLLMLHSARPLWETEGLKDEDKNFYKKLYGNGLGNIEDALFSEESKVTFLCSGTMNRLNKQRVKFYIPQLLSKQTRKDAFIVKVTCLSEPPIDYKKGEEYLGAYVSASLHKLSDKGEIKSANPKATQTGRRKWQPYQHFENVFYKTNPGDWELWLQLWTRWEVEDDFEVPYAIAITIEDPLGQMELYSSIQNEVENRYDLMIQNETRIQI